MYMYIGVKCLCLYMFAFKTAFFLGNYGAIYSLQPTIKFKR